MREEEDREAKGRVEVKVRKAEVREAKGRGRAAKWG